MSTFPPRPAPRVSGPGTPPAISFDVVDARVKEHAAAPTLAFTLAIDAGDTAIRSLTMQVQAQILARSRRYDEETTARLAEIFGDANDWGRTLRGLHWMQMTLIVPPFQGSTNAELLVPCSYDFDVAAWKYLDAVRGGVIPIEFLFTGSVFYHEDDGALRTARLPWDREARFDMPAHLWADMMRHYFPNSAWLRLRKDIFDALLAFRAERRLPTWDHTVETLLREANHG